MSQTAWSKKEVDFPTIFEKTILVGVSGRLEEILITGILRDAGYVMHVVDTLQTALSLLKAQPFDALILDSRLYDDALHPESWFSTERPPTLVLQVEPAPLCKNQLHAIRLYPPFTQTKLLEALEHGWATETGI